MHISNVSSPPQHAAGSGALVRFHAELLRKLGSGPTTEIVGRVGSPDTEALLQALPVPVYITDAAGRITFYNQAAADLWGHRPRLGRDRWCGSWRTYTTDGQLLPHDQSPMAITLKTGKAVRGMEAVAERPDGTRVPFSPFPTPLHDMDGRLVGAINMLIDLSHWKHAEAELCAAEERYRLATEAADDIIWENDLVRGVISWNDALERRFGHSLPNAQSPTEWWFEQIHPDDRARIRAHVDAAFAGRETRTRCEYRFRRADGSYAHVLDRSTLLRDSDGKVIREIGAVLDLSERKQAEEALRLSEERFRLAATAAGLGIADIDVTSGVHHWSVEMREMLGLSEDTPACGETYIALLHPDDLAVAREHHERILRDAFSDISDGVHRIIRPNDGGLRWIASERHAMRNDEGEIVRVIVTNKDITEEKTAQDRIAWAATHDTVTGLQNRASFQDELKRTLDAAVQAGSAVSLLLIDLDNFKLVNDTLGHQAGDKALAAFATRIADAMPVGHTLVRLGGDEFAAILPGTDLAAASGTAAGIIRVLQQPFSIDGRAIDLRASIGISGFPDHCADANRLVQKADLALYAAKASGRSQTRTFEPSMRADLQRQISMLGQARLALDRGWIEPRYQPKVDLASGKVVGFEALLRWRHPGAGLQLPATIACAFDDTELAGLIGDAMSNAVLADMRAWLDRGVQVGKIAINASAAEFRESGYAERLLERLAAHQVPPSLLELEITETAFLGNSTDNVVVALNLLRAAGMTIALDDFGTGFSSLSHLRNFPVDVIKIDRLFVSGLLDSAGDRAIVDAVLRLGRALGLTTVAEGVETQAQADILREHHCILAQGYFFGAALDAADVPTALAAEFA
jgi:diguanylate cyclase (GGDEF)-like protein/PAS domain S-box-containing protein